MHLSTLPLRFLPTGNIKNSFKNYITMRRFFGEGVELKFSDIVYEKIAIQRMKEKVLVSDRENYKSARVQIVEHLKKENGSEYRFIPLADVANVIINKEESSLHKKDYTNRLSTAEMLLDKLGVFLNKSMKKLHLVISTIPIRKKRT